MDSDTATVGRGHLRQEQEHNQMMPHDHRDEYGEPINVSRHNSATYVEPDYLAYTSQAQLPTLSTIGRGPAGKGVIPKIVDNGNGEFTFSLIDDETGEQIMLSENLSAGKLEVHAPNHRPVSGEAVTIDVCVRRGAAVEHMPITIPAGSVGSRWYSHAGSPERSDDSIYYFDIADMVYDGRSKQTNKPMPRANDLCVFITDSNELIFGSIDAVEDGKVVVIAQTIVKVPVPSISEDETWVIGDNDTGLPTRGKDAHVALGNVETLPSMVPAQITESYDEETNTTTFNFGIPEGPVGKAVEVQGGIWTPDTLPDFESAKVNDAFVVYDGDKQFDLYIRGNKPSTSLAYYPWTVVEDWQGRPGSGTHVLKSPYELDASVGNAISVPAAEASLAFAPSDYLTDGDIIIDEHGHLGVLGSSEDNSGDYTIETTGSIVINVDYVVDWEDVENKPFSDIGSGLSVNKFGLLTADVKEEVVWQTLFGKPFSTIGSGLEVDEDGALTVDESVIGSGNGGTTSGEVDFNPSDLTPFNQIVMESEEDDSYHVKFGLFMNVERLLISAYDINGNSISSGSVEVKIVNDDGEEIGTQQIGSGSNIIYVDITKPSQTRYAIDIKINKNIESNSIVVRGLKTWLGSMLAANNIMFEHVYMLPIATSASNAEDVQWATIEDMAPLIESAMNGIGIPTIDGNIDIDVATPDEIIEYLGIGA